MKGYPSILVILYHKLNFCMSFYTIIILLALAIVVTVIAPKVKIAEPILLMAVGIIVGFIPQFNYTPFGSDVIFFIFLPPILYNAAFNIAYNNFNEFRDNIRTISMMAISLVLITMLVIAIIIRLIFPDFPWPIAFIIGAILSPPDAAAASGITQSLKLPKRTNTILEGESLINDASALTAYRAALAAATGGTFILWKSGLEFFITLVGGCLVGGIFAYLLILLLRKVKMDSTPIVSLNLLLPFVAYQFAEECNVSGVLAVVSMGLIIARRMRLEKITSDITNIQSKAMWKTLIYLLNGLIFILIGLEFPYVLKQISTSSIMPLIEAGFIIFITALLIRILILFQYQHRIFFVRKKDKNNHIAPLTKKETLIIGWTGMRGIVSIATAIALPLTLEDGRLFPFRNSIIFLVVIVVILMLLIQGVGLPILVKMLKLDTEDSTSK